MKSIASVLPASPAARPSGSAEMEPHGDDATTASSTEPEGPVCYLHDWPAHLERSEMLFFGIDHPWADEYGWVCSTQPYRCFIERSRLGGSNGMAPFLDELDTPMYCDKHGKLMRESKYDNELYCSAQIGTHPDGKPQRCPDKVPFRRRAGDKGPQA